MKTFDIIATSAMGLESIVAKEVRDLGYDCTSRKWKNYVSR